MTLKTIIVGIIALVAVVLIGCAAGSSSPEMTVSESTKKSSTVNETASQGLDSMRNENSYDTVKSDSVEFPKKLWLLNPGVSIYNINGTIVGSTRLRPHILVYAIDGERAIIDVENNKWVQLSSLSDENPQTMLDGPINSNGLPRVSPEEMMKTTPKGDGN